MTPKNQLFALEGLLDQIFSMRGRFWLWFPKTWVGRLYEAFCEYRTKITYMLRTRNFWKKQAPEACPRGLNIVGYFSAVSGMGEAVRLLTRSCSKVGIPYVICNLSTSAPHQVETAYEHLYQNDNPHAVNLFHVNADSVFHLVTHIDMQRMLSRHNVGYWVWELETFPRKWKAAERCFNEIWTASEFCRNSISKTVSLPVIRIPHAVEINLNASYSKSYFGMDNARFIFLFIFDFLSVYKRKNPLAIVEAFRLAFGGRNDAHLVFKLTNAQIRPSAHQELEKACEGLPVTFINALLTRDELNGLISVCDCYVSLHRSEGFGLTLAEAMYLEKPVIATAYSGNMDFMTEENSFPVKFELTKVGEGAKPYQEGYWAEPDAAHAAELMRFVYDEQSAAAQKAKRAAMDIRRNYCHESVGSLIKNRLEKIMGAIPSSERY